MSAVVRRSRDETGCRDPVFVVRGLDERQDFSRRVSHCAADPHHSEVAAPAETTNRSLADVESVSCFPGGQ